MSSEVGALIVVKPKPGLVVRDPERRFAILPPEGSRVRLSIYWRRRIKDGSVVEVSAPSTEV